MYDIRKPTPAAISQTNGLCSAEASSYATPTRIMGPNYDQLLVGSEDGLVHCIALHNTDPQGTCSGTSPNCMLGFPYDSTNGGDCKHAEINWPQSSGGAAKVLFYNQISSCECTGFPYDAKSKVIYVVTICMSLQSPQAVCSQSPTLIIHRYFSISLTCSMGPRFAQQQCLGPQIPSIQPLLG